MTTSSPFTTSLQTTYFTQDPISSAAPWHHIDTIGAPSSAYTLYLENQDAGVRYFSMWDDTVVPIPGSWDGQIVMLPLAPASATVVHIDVGIPFLTAISIAGAHGNTGLGAPTNLSLVMFATPPS